MAKIKLTNVQLSFPSLFQRAEFNGDLGKFEATLLMDKDSSNAKKIQAAVDSMLAENKVKLSADKICFKDGNLVAYDGYANKMSFKGTSNKRITVINRDKSPIVEDDDIIYAGCFVNAVIDLWYQDSKFGKRINGNILGIQFSKDGEPFGAGGISDDDFDTIEDEDF